MAPLVATAAALAALLLASSSQLLSAAAARPPPPVGSPNSNSTCTTTCGDMQVPYPFGLGPPHCYWPGFNLTCDNRSRPGHPQLLLSGAGDTALRVVNISLADSTVTVLRADVNITSRSRALDGSGAFPLPGAQYTLSEGNELVLIGCNVVVTLIGAGSNSSEEVIGGCAASCSDLEANFRLDSDARSSDGELLCSGIRCCKAAISGSSVPKRVVYRRFDLNGSGDKNPVLAFVAKEGWFDQSPEADTILSSISGPPTPNKWEIPVVLDWSVPLNDTPVIDAVAFMPWCSAKSAHRLCKSKWSFCLDHDVGSLCSCALGYEGNPYITNGCQDINECDHPEVYKCFGKCTNVDGTFECRCPHGTHGNYTIPNGCRPITGIIIGIGFSSGAGFVLLVLIAFLIAQRIKRRRVANLKQKYFRQNRGQLLQQLVSQRADIAERMIIPVDELAKATNNFDKTRELGGGGHGTVYKGILSDLHVVAIKKSKITVQKEIDEFINEVAILSQINHKNVVKLYGCCLETEVPLLVYEFISNGTLYHHLHMEGPITLSWANRLRIATEISTALAYLHSSSTVPIIHRDIKSSNILLDDTLTSKVSDFGASRYIPVDRTGLTTRVQGTIGYLDPMYFYTGRLTDKSDVYSFGVILVELLTRKKPFSYLSPDGDGLASHFANLLTEENLVQILDPLVIEEGGEEVQQVAKLAASCIKLSGEDRPTMRTVELTLARLQASKKNAEKNMVAREFDDGSIGMSCPSTKEEPSAEESSRRYSMEQELLMSARYPR
ncbi:unnamed protein product [Urochloa decumbens]|uniref:Protein kinase domain-containing protein n=1 Tax=Urochloa decumbens TaxID=240449 RepID=A0ABC9AUP9_9POAL